MFFDDVFYLLVHVVDHFIEVLVGFDDWVGGLSCEEGALS